MAAGSVFVVGSLHLDVVVSSPRLPAIDETVAGHGASLVCGGKGGNQAVAAALHGAKTHMAGRVGDDAFAERLLSHLAGARVEHSRVQTGTGSSGMSVAVVLDNGDYGAVIVSAANLDLDPAAITWPDDASWVVLQNEIPEPVNIEIARRARAHGAQVLLNAAPWRETSERLLSHIDLLVLNRVEAAAMACTALDSVADAKRVAAKLATRQYAAIVTLGADGVVYHSASGEELLQPACAVNVVSTHGAGDVFVGALAARMSVGDEIVDALRYAAAAAAAHVSTPVAHRLSVGPGRARALMVSPPR